MNSFEKYNHEQNKEILKMVSKADWVYAWVMTSAEDGEYLEVKKGSIREGIKNDPMRFDVNQFDLRTDGNLYIN